MISMQMSTSIDGRYACMSAYDAVKRNWCVLCWFSYKEPRDVDHTICCLECRRVRRGLGILADSSVKCFWNSSDAQLLVRPWYFLHGRGLCDLNHMWRHWWCMIECKRGYFTQYSDIMQWSDIHGCNEVNVLDFCNGSNTMKWWETRQPQDRMISSKCRSQISATRLLYSVVGYNPRLRHL